MGDKKWIIKIRIKKLKPEDYRKYFGVTKETFDRMLAILEEADKEKHKKGERPYVLSILDKLVITLQYYREYRTMDNIAFDYGTNKSTVFYAIEFVEDTLIKSEKFHLPSRKEILDNKSVKIIAVVCIIADKGYTGVANLLFLKSHIQGI